ncbi:Gfo/Idh/MocA family protein [Armatimonas sp.]|uniref:Gfo/Idh/MocA family protein n=1 Tax=Armatimonas sp. TaxID=1872638 RepID=UPI0037513681
MSQNRREFLTGAAALGMGMTFADKALAKQGGKVRFACIGVGGKGDSDTADAARFGEVVAICDVDENTVAKALKKYPNAKPFTDWRKCLKAMAKEVDAVTVTVPDHMHGIIAANAMRMGKHTFCQKPLCRTIYEARRLAEIATEMKVQTQMGNQGTADPKLRKQAAQVRAGIIGKVSEIHVWSNRPIWPQGIARPTAVAPPPTGLNWDTWLGVAPVRPFVPGAYHTFNWRGWWDFGSGAQGDMGCHTLNMPFMALDLRDPISIQSETAPNNGDSFPAWSVTTFMFAATSTRGPIKLVWYDGNKQPSLDVLGDAIDDDWKLQNSGSLLIGDKGKIYVPGDYGSGGRVVGGVDLSNVGFEESPGHFQELVRAIKEGKPAMSNFPGYAGPLAEMVLAGNLGVRAAGKKVEWDARAMKATNMPELDVYIKPKYRRGYDMI